MGNEISFGNFTDFQEDEDVVKNGVDLALGKGRFLTITRAAETNRRYRNALAEAYRPHKMAVDRGTLDNETATRILHKVFAETVVIGWRGIKDEVGRDIPFTSKNVELLFREFPEVFKIVRDEADRFSNFARQEVEEAGNG